MLCTCGTRLINVRKNLVRKLELIQMGKLINVDMAKMWNNDCEITLIA